MKEIQTNNRVILIVEVPEEYACFSKYILRFLSTLRISFIDNEGYFHSLDVDEIDEDLLQGKKLKDLGRLSELKDEDCERFVGITHTGGVDLGVGGITCKVFKDYKSKINYGKLFFNAKQSFISLLESNDIDVSNEKTILIIEKL